jgi:hypothetical protein
MTNTEIDRKLALAIGWKPEDVVVGGVGPGDCCFLVVSWWVTAQGDNMKGERRFSHQDPTVILPIMERHDCLPHKLWNDEWVSYFEDMPGVAAGVHTNPRTAAALAVIKAKEMGLI